MENVNQSQQESAAPVQENVDAAMCPFEASHLDVITRLRAEAPYLFYADKAPMPVPDELLELAEDEAEHFFDDRPRVAFLLSEMPPIAPQTLAKIAEIVARPWDMPFGTRLTKEDGEHNKKILEEALRLAALGYLVMPANRPHPIAGCTAALTSYNRAVRKGEVPSADWVARQLKRAKFPVGKDWQLRASCDLETVWKNFNEYPASIWKDGVETEERETRYINFKVNLSMITGLSTGRFALDVDGNEARQRLRDLEEKHGKLPPTVQSETGSGVGDHYAFDLPPGVELHNTASRFGSGGSGETGLDIRAYHGQIMIAPSEHKSGRSYRWVNSPFDVPSAMAPQWVIDEAIACSKIAQREQAERDGTAAPGASKTRTKRERVDGDDSSGEYDPKRDGLPGGVDNRIAQIGYGPGTAGCIHYAVFSAALSLFGQRGYSADVTDLVAAIRERLKVVVAERPDKSDYLKDTTYVANRVENARQEAKGWGWPETKPYAYASLEEAERAIAALPDEDERQAQRAAKIIVECIASSGFDETDRGELAKLMAKKTGWTATSIKKDFVSKAKKLKAAKKPNELADLVADFNKKVVQYEGPAKVEYLLLDVPPGCLPKQYDESNFLRTKLATAQVEGVGAIGPLWLEHEDRRAVTKIDFAPPGSPPLPPDTFNVWNSWPVLADVRDLSNVELEAECSLYLDHVRDVIANGDQGAADYILDWLADIIQQPGQKPGSALGLVGGFGGGKSSFWQMLKPILGDYLHKMNTSLQAGGQFTDHRAAKLLQVYEEVSHAGDHAGQKQQRDEITAEEIFVNSKFRSAYMLRDHARKLYLGNDEKELVRLEEGDRRLSIFRTSDRYEKLRETDPAAQKAYFSALRRQMLDGKGCAALAELLRRREYNQDRLREPYETAAKETMRRGQLDPAQRWLVDCVQLGEIDSGARDPADPAEALGPIYLSGANAITTTVRFGERAGQTLVALPQAKLRTHFKEELRTAPERYASAKYGTIDLLGELLQDLFGALPERHQATIDGGERVWCWLVPPLEEIERDLMDRGYIRFDPRSPEETGCVSWEERIRELREVTNCADDAFKAAVDAALPGGDSRRAQVVEAHKALVAALKEERSETELALKMRRVT